jgi:hypothetical protein
MTSGLKLIMREWISKYDKKDQLDVCLNAYTGDSTEINVNAREGRSCEKVEQFRNLFKDAPCLPYPMTIYRGLDQSYIQSYLTSGEPHIDHGFFSTSTCLEVASGFATGVIHLNCEVKDCEVCLFQSQKQPCLLRMVLPAGTPFFFPDYQDTYLGGQIFDSGEHEIIIAPGSLIQTYKHSGELHPFAQRQQNLQSVDKKKVWTENLVWIPIINTEIELVRS